MPEIIDRDAMIKNARSCLDAEMHIRLKAHPIEPLLKHKGYEPGEINALMDIFEEWFREEIRLGMVETLEEPDAEA